MTGMRLDESATSSLSQVRVAATTLHHLVLPEIYLAHRFPYRKSPHAATGSTRIRHPSTAGACPSNVFAPWVYFKAKVDGTRSPLDSIQGHCAPGLACRA